MTYVLVFSLLLLLRLESRREFSSLWYYLSIIFLFFFSAFRFEVGCDWFNYISNFNLQKYRDFLDAITNPNPLHWIMLETLDVLGLGYVWVNICTSFIFFLGLNALASRTPSRLSFLVFLFPILILNIPMAAVKQAAAMGLICFAFVAFIDRKIFKCLLFVSLAFFFHSSAGVFFLLVPFILGRSLVSSILFSIPLLAPVSIALLGSNAAETASDRYLDGDMDAAGAIFRVGFVALSGVVFFLFLREKWKNLQAETYKLVSILSAGMIFLFFLVPVSTVIADRFAYYFTIPQAMIVAALPTLVKRGEVNKILRPLPYIALLIIFVSWTQLSSHFQRCYVPYNSVFFNWL